MTAVEASDCPPADVAATPPSRTRQPAGTARWTTFAGLCAFALVWSAYSVEAQSGAFLTQDLGAQYHLAKLTAEGAIPLVDFQHGWNSGSWWVNAVLYVAAGGNPTLWYFLWGRLLGAGLAGVLAAAIGLRLRLHPSAMIAMAFGVVLLATPLHIKYGLLVVWVFLLLPTGWLESRPRLGATLRVLVPALMFWQYVELAVLMTGATGLFELIARRDATWRTRMVHCLQLSLGFLLGLVSEALLYRLVWDLPFASFNDQVIFGQAETSSATLQYAVWDFFALPATSGRYVILALYPFALLLPFLPAVWRHVSDSTRLVALAGLVCVVVPIRRVTVPHTTTVAALVLMAVVMAAAECHDGRHSLSEVVQRRASWLKAAPFVVAGAVWAGLALKVGFGMQGMLGAVVLVVLTVAGALAGHLLGRRAVVAVSVGAGLVLTGVPALASVDHLNDMRHLARPFANSDAIARAIRPELPRCTGGSKEALVIPNYLSLYDALELHNPTPYYLFHYDIVRSRTNFTRRLEDGSVPVVVDTMPLHTPQPWLTEAIEANYVPCARVHLTSLAMTITVWSHSSRGPVAQRDITLNKGQRTVRAIP